MSVQPSGSSYLYEFERETRPPRERAPLGSWDSQIHVFGSPEYYPLADGRVYDPPRDATIEAALRMHRTLGIERGVIVQPTAYGTDHRLLLDALAQAPGYRATAIVDDRVSDAELARLHAAGVRGARFNFKAEMGAIPERASLLRSLRRISELGWHAKIRSSGEELMAHVDLLAEINITVILDHMGHIDLRRGVNQPAVRLVLELLRERGWWVMLSNADKHDDAPWEHAVEIAQLFLATAPDRSIWASDWPHLGYRNKPVPNSADIFSLARRFAPDEITYRRLMVENPARLYGF